MAENELDDGLEKLERFCAELEDCIAALAEDGGALIARAAALDHVEDEVRTAYGGLADALASAGADLDGGLRDAIAADEHLADTCRTLESAEVASAEHRLEEEASEAAGHLGGARSRLETQVSEAREAGFETLTTSLRAADGAAAVAATEAQTAIATLHEAVTAATEELREGRQQVAGAFEAATPALEQARDGITDSSVALGSACDGAAASVAARAAGAADSLAALYQSWGDETVADGEQLADAIDQLLREVGTLVVDDVGTALDREATLVLEGALPALDSALASLTQIAAAAEPASEEASMHVDDLLVARRVITKVDELLDSMQVDA